MEFSRVAPAVPEEADEVDCDDEEHFFPRAGDVVETPENEYAENYEIVGGGGYKVGTLTGAGKRATAEDTNGAKLYICPRTHCSVCGGKLSRCNTDTVRARVAFPSGMELAAHGAKRCCRKGCRARHRYNYFWRDGEKINSTWRFDEIEAIFLSDNYGVSIRAIQMAAERLFRAKTSFLAEAASFNAVVAGDGKEDEVITDKRAAAYLQQAYFIYTKIANIEKTNGSEEDASFPIDDPIKDADAPAIFTCKPPADVREIVFDGHFKLNRPPEKDEENIARRKRGRPKKADYPDKPGCASKNKWGKLPKDRTGGLLMAVHPGTGNILGAKELINSETADEKVALLGAILRRNPDADCLIHDDACHFQDQVAKRAKRGNENAKLIKGQTKFYILDRFRERNRKYGNRDRPTSARNAARLKHINTSRAESVFARFRNYHHCNAMKRRNFCYLTQQMCRKRNVSNKTYLNPCAKTEKTRGSF